MNTKITIASKTAQRIYLVTIGTSERLVKAAHPAAALMYVARDLASVRVASQDDLVARLQKGVIVEVPSERLLLSTPI